MAFGDLLDFGNARTNGTTVGDSVEVGSAQINVAVAIGDLIYAVWVETTSNGVNGVSDNLGNTYTPLSAATDSGTITGRAFYARVTTAGTLNTITFDTTDNTNEGIAGVAVFEGPFDVSPLDRNPTNVEDTTDPFNHPATGVLAQAEELIVQWFAGNQPGSGMDVVSPSLEIMDVHDGGTGPNYRLLMGYRVVAATTSITPQSTLAGASAPSDSVLGTSTFKMSLSVSIAPPQGNLALSGQDIYSRGDLMAFAMESGASVTNPVTIDSGSNTPLVSTPVAVGDLIFATFGEQTSLTVTGVTDNLGNSYSALNAGTDAGAVAGRAFYSRVTVAGNLTSVSFAATASSNDYAAMVSVWKGPFPQGPLDANPANSTADITTPIDIPPTGSLAQMVEIVLGWIVNAPTVATSAGSGTLIGAIASSTLVAVAQLYQNVAGTGSIGARFNFAGDQTVAVSGVASFRYSSATPLQTTDTYVYPSQGNLALSTTAPIVSVATLVPDADVSDGTWVDQSGGTSLFAAIDDQEDASYIQSSPRSNPGPHVDTAQVAFSNPPAGLTTPFEVEYRYKKEGDGLVDLTVRLMQGAVEIAEWTHTNISASTVKATQTLTAPQFAAITDFNDLRIEFEASTVAPVLAGQLKLSSEPPVVVGGFSPSQFGTDLIAWFDATRGVHDNADDTVMAADGALVWKWANQSSRGDLYDVRQGEEGMHPTYRRASTVMNGKPALEFTPYVSGLRSRSGGNTIHIGTGVTAISMFAVVAYGMGITFGNDNRILSYRAAGDFADYASPGGMSLILNTYYDPVGVFKFTGYRRNDFIPGSGHFLMQPISADTPYRLGCIQVDGSTRANYVNGTAFSEANEAQGNFSSSGEIGVGVNPYPPGETDAAQWGGWMCEIVFVKRALTTAEIAALDAYFRSKWGFSS